MSLVEMMVGIVIGLIAVLVIYQVYGVSERYKRITTTAGDAQTTGQFSTFYLSREIGNAGAGISVNAEAFASCPVPDFDTTLRGAPVLIQPGASNAAPDQLTVYFGASLSLVTPAIFTLPAVAGGTYTVQSPTGFAANDVIVAIDKIGGCARSTITAVAHAPTYAADGQVIITHAPTAAIGFPSASYLINLGPDGTAMRSRFDVVGNVLRQTDLFAAAPVPNPLVGNVVNFKVQYGLDTSVPADGVIDVWLPATDAGWTPAMVMNGVAGETPKQIAQRWARILAVRIGVVVRGDEWDPQLAGTTFQYTLFNCGAACPSPIVNEPIVNPATGGWRYRVYETVVPLRNTIWNPVT